MKLNLCTHHKVTELKKSIRYTNKGLARYLPFKLNSGKKL